MRWFEQMDWPVHALHHIGIKPLKKYYGTSCEVFHATHPEHGELIVKLADEPWAVEHLLCEDAVYRKMEGRVPLAHRIAYHESLPTIHSYGVLPIHLLHSYEHHAEMESLLQSINPSMFIRSYVHGQDLSRHRNLSENVFVQLEEQVKCFHANSIARLNLDQAANVLLDEASQPYLFDFGTCLCPAIAGSTWPIHAYKDRKDLEVLYERTRDVRSQNEP